MRQALKVPQALRLHNAPLSEEPGWPVHNAHLPAEVSASHRPNGSHQHPLWVGMTRPRVAASQHRTSDVSFPAVSPTGRTSQPDPQLPFEVLRSCPTAKAQLNAVRVHEAAVRGRWDLARNCPVPRAALLLIVCWPQAPIPTDVFRFLGESLPRASHSAATKQAAAPTCSCGTSTCIAARTRQRSRADPLSIATTAASRCLWPQLRRFHAPEHHPPQPARVAPAGLGRAGYPTWPIKRVDCACFRSVALSDCLAATSGSHKKPSPSAGDLDSNHGAAPISPQSKPWVVAGPDGATIGCWEAEVRAEHARGH